MLQSTGPTTAVDALAWAQEAIAASRYLTDPHFDRRCRQRGITLRDAQNAIRRASHCAAYAGGTPLAGGTCWRIVGPDLDGEETTVGVEAFEDHLGRRVLLITVF
jgi:hypothetical protein